MEEEDVVSYFYQRLSGNPVLKRELVNIPAKSHQHLDLLRNRKILFAVHMILFIERTPGPNCICFERKDELRSITDRTSPPSLTLSILSICPFLAVAIHPQPPPTKQHNAFPHSLSPYQVTLLYTSPLSNLLPLSQPGVCVCAFGTYCLSGACVSYYECFFLCEFLFVCVSVYVCVYVCPF